MAQAIIATTTFRHFLSIEMVFLCTLISVLVMLPILLFLLSLKVFPGDLLPSTYPDPAIENEVKNRTELERRNSYMSTLESKLGEGHGVVSLIKECLADDPERRPTAHQAMDRLSDMVGDLRPPFFHMNRYRV